MDETMNKRPSLQFYPADWRKDPQLQMACMATQGMWINLLCIMWESDPEGIIQGSPLAIKRILGCTDEEYDTFICDIKLYLFGDVTESDGLVTIKCRRMHRAFLEREGAKYRMRKHRKTESCTNVTPPSSTSSSSSTTNNKYTSLFNLFDEARKLFKGTKRGLETEYENFRKHADWQDVLPLLKPAVEQQIRWRAADGRYWKNFKTWINSRCWEETEGVVVSNTPTNSKHKLFPIKGHICGHRDCELPAVYKNSSGPYDQYSCPDHMPAPVKERYE